MPPCITHRLICIIIMHEMQLSEPSAYGLDNRILLYFQKPDSETSQAFFVLDRDEQNPYLCVHL
ncbi:hypothetical protein [Pontibacter arcticus]|uniref:hypothetical protein n=1 Tax=Pontibacter arcticus TaxID=2080288 RepID=UPI00140335D3|nr:hypothetical protein [Pontibacter arcticus]